MMQNRIILMPAEDRIYDLLLLIFEFPQIIIISNMEEVLIQNNSPDPGILAEKSDQETSSYLYQEVITKNFQIFKNILPRINLLFQMNDQLQKCVGSIQKKLGKMQTDNQNLHYEMRTNYLAIDTKLNSIIAEFTNISCETGRIRNQTDQLKRQFYQEKVKSFTQKMASRQQEINTAKLKITERPYKQKRIAFVDEINHKNNQQNQMISNKYLMNRQKRRSIINLSSQTSIKQNKVKFNLSQKQISNSEISIPSKSKVEQKLQTQKTDKQSNRKANLNPSRNISTFKEIQPHNIFTQKMIAIELPGKEEENLTFQNFLKQMENYHIHNQKIQKNYEQLMAEYCRVQQTQFINIHSQIKAIEARMNQICASLTSTGKLSYNFQNQIQTIKQYVDQKLQEKAINQNQLQNLIQSINQRLKQVYDLRNKMANKEQTKRALQFLEAKINTVLQDYYNSIKIKKALKTVEMDSFGCFRTLRLSNRNCSGVSNNNAAPLQVSIIQPNKQIKSISKKQTQSVHTKRLVLENRFNQQLVDVQARNERASQSCHGAKNFECSARILKKKSIDILSKQKTKHKNRLKKQRITFQYD